MDRAFDYTVPEELSTKIGVGSLVRVPFGKRKVRGIVVDVDASGARSERDLEAIASVVVKPSVAPPPMTELLDWMARRYAVARGVVFSRVVPPRVRVTNVHARPGISPSTPATLLPLYSSGQDLMTAIASGEGGIWSLRALPGQDRGRLISELLSCVGDGGSALVTVPEVRYGSPVLDVIEKNWPELARVDSSQDAAGRARSWLALASGHGLGAGGRATLLAPAPDLRLIVVDEEHHSTYKEDRSPRYHARRVAVERARLQGAVCVLVSATPALETSFMVQEGKWRQALPDRGSRRFARPIIEVVPAPEDRALGPELHARMRDVLRSGKRVGLLVPSSGYARALWCSSCRRSLRCPACEAGLFYDRAGACGPSVRCVRCGFGNRAPDTCPDCGASDWRYVGAGSERLEDQIGKAFPRARVRRVDPSILDSEEPEAFSDADVYVTTWIGTKPVLRPDVGLVGVLNADALIRRANFRSAEHAYQALGEMSEWAGSAQAGGRLIVQTSDPGHHSIQAVVRADHDYFVARELEARRPVGYPPWNDLLKVTASGPDASRTIEAAAKAVRGAAIRVLGPIDVHRSTPDGPVVDREILIKCPNATEVASRLRELLAGVPGGALKVDADPR